LPFLSIYVIYASVSHETTPPDERPRAPHAPRGRRAGLRLLARDGHGSAGAGDIAGEAGLPARTLCRSFLPARTLCRSFLSAWTANPA
jgi:hypothetical protein